MTITKHKNLDTKLWDKNKTLNPAVSELLMSMVWSFIDNVRSIHLIDIKNSDICDVFIYGSCANYFYTTKSDIDMCIIFDFDTIFKRNPGLNSDKDFKLYYYNWMMTHTCLIYGRKIDVSFEDKKNTISDNGRYRSGPVWSLMQHRWLFEPINISDLEFKKIVHDSKAIYNEIVSDFDTVKKNGYKLAEMQKLYHDIYASKNASHTMNLDQPVTYMYIAFRKIRDTGLIDKLRNRIIATESEKFILK